jgi:chromosome partitioning protein
LPLLHGADNLLLCMKIVALVSQKGGAGKTTLALHLACAAQAGGLASAIIDLDPQASAAAWHDSRAQEEPVVVPLPYTRLAHGLEIARESGADLVLIDTAPHSETAALAAARAADLVLIPCRLSILDLRAIGDTAELVKIAQKPALVVLNAYHPRAVEMLADAQAAVAMHGLSIAPAGLAARASFSHSLIAGLTALEYEPVGRASQEVTSLFAWLCDAIGLAAMQFAGNTAH